VQSATVDEDEPVVVLHTTTRRVLVDVVVTGPDGKPVTGLTEQDFTVSEDHKPQSVRSFEAHTPEIDQSRLPIPPPLSSHSFVNLQKTPASGPLVVLLLDALNSNVNDQMSAHQQILSFLQHKPASTQVAIFTLGDQLSMLQGFTTDTDKLLAVMHTRAAGPHMPAASELLLRGQITLDAFLTVGRFLSVSSGRKNLLWFAGSFDMMVMPKARDVDAGAIDISAVQPDPKTSQASTSASVGQNIAMAQSGTVPTQSTMSSFNPDFGDLSVLQDRLRKVAAALAVSQTAVYPVDVRGLTTDPSMTAAATMTASPSGGPSAAGWMNQTSSGLPASVQSHMDYLNSLNSEHATMEALADATGGQAFVNSNGIAEAATKAVNEGSYYYTLAYAPANLNFDGSLRSIHVALNKPDCHLAYRSAYYAVDPAEVSPEDSQAGELSSAMVHGAPQSQDLLFKTVIEPVGAAALAPPESPLAVKSPENPKKKKHHTQQLSGLVQNYDIRLAIMSKQLQFQLTPDGRHHAALEIAVYAYGADGQRLGGTRQKLQTSMPPLVYNNALSQGVFHHIQVQLPVEAASLRLAVLDPGNHHAGSLEVALPLPPEQQAAD